MRGEAAVVPAFSAGPEFSFVFQPIVDADAGAIISYEALIRGRINKWAAAVFAPVLPAEMHRFDECARPVAIELTTRLELQSLLNP